jgi:DNA-binding NarL/FixJ family response regulator
MSNTAGMQGQTAITGEGDRPVRVLVVDDEPLIVQMLTAKREDEDQVTGLENGADDFLIKPFTLPVLLARMQEYPAGAEIPPLV